VQPFLADLMTWRFRVAITAVVAVALVLASCGRNPNGPQPPGSSPPGAPGGVVGLAVTAPAEIAPGATVQLTAHAVKSNGSVEDVTSQVQWGSTTGLRLVTVSAGGLATAGAIRGETEIIAHYEGRSASARLMVLPTGTFHLKGRITENGFGVPNVIVTVVAGVGEGLASGTGGADWGAYSLYGVGGRVRLRARKEGYLDAIQEIEVSAHSAHDFELVPERPVPNLAGAYTFTVTSGCRTAVGTLPDAAKRRTYSANVTQDQRWLTVVLSGADFLIADGHGDRFGGLLDASGRVQFLIMGVESTYYADSPYCFRCDLVERLTANTALVISGTVAAALTTSDSEISGVLFGAFFVADKATHPLTRFPIQCTGIHDFVLRRR